MKRLLVMTCTVVAMEAVSANTAYTSKDYVQAGLVAQWDGIDNMGTGAHVSNASVWKLVASQGADAVESGTALPWGLFQSWHQVDVRKGSDEHSRRRRA